MIRQSFGFAMICAACVVPSVGHAGVEGFLLGTDAPPGTIGGVAFTPFALDTQPWFLQPGASSITSVAVDGSNPPSGPTIGFSLALTHQRIAEGWATWSHGYMGDIYRKPLFAGPTVDITMPAGTQGFYLYAEPGPFSEFSFTMSAVTDAGSTVSLTDSIHGMFGAKGFAFVADPGESLATITVSAMVGGDYAIGEFGIAIPAPATLVLFGLASSGQRRRR